ncbi:HAD-IIB family hydrolase [Oceaniglobus ichthyenteri]|uniref:HAD-IIB family hydrolase n=1 Tax=Oceaniglobus ichthyenteri TaxID=2136177 RepID=UPI003B83332E
MQSTDTTLSDKHFVLATDLDGTFLGGTEDDRKRLYDWIEAHRDTVGLIFVTGRDPQFIEHMCHDGLPWPEYVIGDVGTTIAQVVDKKVSPIPALETEISKLWGNAGHQVRTALAAVPGLTLQETDFRYRVSYDYDPDTFDSGAHDIIGSMGLDTLVSDNRYFDVLPKGISKGPSLRLLANHLNIAHRRLLAAGDTMNDYSMLALGVPAVAVGGSEPALSERLRDMNHVYHAKAIGAAGIQEAIAALNLHPNV